MDNSSLAHLSPELRNLIYGHALYERRPVAISKNFSTEPALLRTCKQIREEAELLFYAVNDFTGIATIMADDEHDGDGHIIRWLHRAPVQKLALIKSLTIRVEIPGFEWQGILEPLNGTRPESERNKPLCSKLIACLQESTFGHRRAEHVLNFAVHGASDNLLMEELAMVDDLDERIRHYFASYLTIDAAFGEDMNEIFTYGGLELAKDLHTRLRENRSSGISMQSQERASA